VLLPPRRCRRPLCSPRVVGRVHEGLRGWRSRPLTASSGAVSLREHLSSTGQSPSDRCLWSRRARWDAPLRSVRVESPSPMGRASTNATMSNALPACRAESWKSSIITRCCSCVCCVGWVTGGAPVSYVPPISSAVPPNKSSNGNSSGGVSPV
jgi:hypothetical protein